MKMSDALRGAAEQAPVEEIHVSTSAVRSRARRNRAVRVGANGVVGVGAAALLFAGVTGVVANQTALIPAENDGAAPADLGAVEGGAADPSRGTSELAQGGCGFGLDFTAFPQGPVDSTVAVTGINDGAATVDLGYSTKDSGEFTVDSATVYVVWNDLIVGTVGPAWDTIDHAVTADTPLTVPATVDLVNCWDGTALPAGNYTLVTMTSLLSGEIPPVPEPTGEPAVDPGTEPTVDPDTSVSSDVAVEDDAALDITDLISYSISNTVELTIAGDPAKDPFEQYLNPVDPVDPEPTLPSDALTSDEARAAYEAALVLGPWSMKPGTQRVVLTGDSRDTNGELWNTSYYGCPMDGVSDSFPKESADLNWLTATANLPSSLHVSYGWIVDGNPMIHYGVTNDSEWSLPGFYEGASPRLVLVKNGKVVAEAYPVNPNQNGGQVMPFTADGDVAAATEGGDKLIYAPETGYLAPGQSVRGDYLWRDVNGCWTSTGQATVGPGQYTVLSAQDIYLGGMYATAYGAEAEAQARQDEAEVANGNVSSGDGGDGGDEAVEPIIAPAPDESDYISFTVWTSLGTVTVTN
ncbi:hypothetical protein [Demequina sp.]|uniref:hypothetical protein n=1 Tax=Demequina sp. TaxID=2050685 RepID=UPI003D1070C3